MLVDDCNGYWEDGTVVAYLPPEEDEPMALWKVRLDARPTVAAAAADRNSGGGEVGDDRFQDMEELEVVEAMSRIV